MIGRCRLIQFTRELVRTESVREYYDGFRGRKIWRHKRHNRGIPHNRGVLKYHPTPLKHLAEPWHQESDSNDEHRSAFEDSEFRRKRMEFLKGLKDSKEKYSKEMKNYLLEKPKKGWPVETPMQRDERLHKNMKEKLERQRKHFEENQRKHEVSVARKKQNAMETEFRRQVQMMERLEQVKELDRLSKSWLLTKDQRDNRIHEVVEQYLSLVEEDPDRNLPSASGIGHMGTISFRDRLQNGPRRGRAHESPSSVVSALRGVNDDSVEDTTRP
ncbi:hypothetical protein NDN08_000358 [Rhodosorus marinus]|uniref:FF domain-containing protein n=1 Tax=Rhodosorus marinus TaxID=101924 RepID=A0AAV8UMP5_9RHOD|nr:hypothetical protein NDN08_000358 [Rhodosorus marinus]